MIGDLVLAGEHHMPVRWKKDLNGYKIQTRTA